MVTTKALKERKKKERKKEGKKEGKKEKKKEGKILNNNLVSSMTCFFSGVRKMKLDVLNLNRRKRKKKEEERRKGTYLVNITFNKQGENR